MTADLRDVLGKRILDAARMAAALHLQQSVELARRQVTIGGAGQDQQPCNGPRASEGCGGTRSRLWSADGVGE